MAVRRPLVRVGGKNVQLPAGDTMVARHRTNVLTKGMFGRYRSQNPGVVHTVCVTMELECEFTAVRVLIPNHTALEVAGVRVSVAVTNDFVGGHWNNAVNPTGGEWIDATFDGQTSGVIQPVGLTKIAALTPTDLVELQSIPRASGAPRPLLMVRVQFPVTTFSIPNGGNYNWRVDGAHRPMRVSKQDVAGVDNKAAFTSATSVDTNVFIPVIQYMSAKEGRQVLIAGDSTTEGIGDSVTAFGAVQRACVALSTPDDPIEYFNAGLSSMSSPVFSQVPGYYAGLINPTHVFYGTYSVNDAPVGGLNAAALARLKGGLGRAMHELRMAPRPAGLFLTEGLPNNPAYRDMGAGDQVRRDLNAWLHTITGARAISGYAAAITGSRDTDGQDAIASGMTTDNLHPNTAGYTALAETVKPYLLES